MKYNLTPDDARTEHFGDTPNEKTLRLIARGSHVNSGVID